MEEQRQNETAAIDGASIHPPPSVSFVSNTLPLLCTLPLSIPTPPPLSLSASLHFHGTGAGFGGRLAAEW